MKTCRYRSALKRMEEENRSRFLRETHLEGREIVCDGKRMVNLASNDYMGIAGEESLWQDFLKQETARDDFGGSVCSSRLLTGNSPDAVALENELRTMYGASGALIFNSGYHANLGILPAISTGADLILSDKLIHASLIDGIRLSPAKHLRFPHNDLDCLAAILKKRRSDFDRVFIVTESIFSMDGDCADLARLVSLKEKYDALLYLDEAHAVGVRGPCGLGLAEEEGVLEQIDFLVGTFGKAYASQGAFVIADKVMCDYLVNTMRPLIFSTALPPLSLRWTRRVLQYLAGEKERRTYLQKLSAALRRGLVDAGLETGGGSHIVPLMVRDNARAIQFSRFLCDNGFFVLPIRAPSVPAGKERLRISLHAGLTTAQIETFSSLCKQFGH